MRDGWSETTLGDVAEVVGGGTPSTTKEEFWDGDVIWLTPTEVTAIDGKVISDSKRKITQAGLRSSGARILPRGTVILTSRASVGFVALAGTELTTNQGFQSLIPSESVDGVFLMFWIQMNRSEFESRSAGSTFKEISKSNVKSIAINLPPLVEQKRIVDLVSSADAYIDALQQQVDSARTARNAVLHELLSAGGDDWTETTLGEIITLEYGKPLKAENRDGKGFPVFGSAGEVGLHSEPLVNEAPVIVVGRKGTAGAVWWSDLPCSVIDTAYYVVQKVETDIRFLYFILGYLDLPSLTAQTGVPGLNRDRAYSSRVLLPLLDEQKRIVEILSSMDDVIQSTEQAVVEAKNLRSGLLSDLLSGEHEIPASYDSLLGAA
jgi:type I restriction enzyme S subunit